MSERIYDNLGRLIATIQPTSTGERIQDRLGRVIANVQKSDTDAGSTGGKIGGIIIPRRK